MKYTSTREVFEAFLNKKVLVIGDAMLDTFSIGWSDKLSPEAPVPILKVGKRFSSLGGAANVARNVARLGATPYLCSVIGADSSGNRLLNLMQKENIETDYMLQSPERATTQKHRVLSGSQHLLRLDTEQDDPLSTQEKTALLESIQSILPQVDLVIFQDYDKGCLDEFIIQEVLKAATQLKIPTIADPKFRNFYSYEGVFLLKPNWREFSKAIGIEKIHPDPGNLLSDVIELRQKMNVKHLLVTLGSEGVIWSTSQHAEHLHAHPRDVLDVCGAGDAVIAVAALAIGVGADMRYAAELANLAGGLVCEKTGVAPIEPELLIAEATNDQFLNSLFDQ